jgi:hypothetical protein
MNPELQKKFYEKYPVLFQDTSKSMQESCMHWGIEFGDGWATIFDQLCEYLTKLSSRSVYLKAKPGSSDKLIKCPYPEVKFEQVKEKFGTMCVYWSVIPRPEHESLKSQLENPQDLDRQLERFSDQVSSVVSYADFLSSKTCEITGDPGRLITGSWLKVRCDKCLALEQNHEAAGN